MLFDLAYAIICKWRHPATMIWNPLRPATGYELLLDYPCSMLRLKASGWMLFADRRNSSVSGNAGETNSPISGPATRTDGLPIWRGFQLLVVVCVSKCKIGKMPNGDLRALTHNRVVPGAGW